MNSQSLMPALLTLALKPLGRAVALVLLCLVLWLPGLSTLPPFDRDESRFAQASKQMVETKDFVTINFQETPRNKKPVGIYWMQSASALITGATTDIWAYRLPSLLGGITAVLLTAAMGARLLSPLSGLLAGAALASCLLMGVESRLAKTDAMLLASICLSLYPLVRLWAEKTVSKPVALIFWGGLALGTLIKGPVPLLALAGPLVLIARRDGIKNTISNLQTPLGAGLFLLAVLPWFVAITLKTHGAFWAESVGKDLLAKATSGQESHGAPPGYYALTSFLTFWPWMPLLVPAIWLAWKKKSDPIVQFLAVWTLPFWLIFEIIPTKLLHYTLPTFPALTLLMLWAFSQPELTLLKEAKPPLLVKTAKRAALALVVAVMIAVPLLATSQGATALVLITSALLVGFVIVAFFMPPRLQPVAALLQGLALIIFYATSFGVSLPDMKAPWISREAAAMIAPYRASCPLPVASIGYTEPSLVFLLGTQTELLSKPEDLRPLTPDTPCQLVLWAYRPTEFLPIRGEVLGKITGFNYSRGKTLELVLTRLGQE